MMVLPPLADLHVHLEGAVPEAALATIAARHGLKQWSCEGQPRSFGAFFSAFRRRAALLRETADITFAAAAAGRAIKATGVEYAELHVSPGLLARYCQAGIEQILLAVYGGFSKVSGIRLRLIIDVVRHHPMALVDEIVAVALELRREAGIVALGLGGREQTELLQAHARNFRRAVARGLPVVAHAGEQAGPEDVAACLRFLPVSRLGHGLSAINDPSLLRRLAQEQIPLELCLTSNLALTDVGGVMSHPIHRALDAGVPIILGTDDPAIFATDLPSEFALLARQGLNSSVLDAIANTAWRYAFDAPPATRGVVAAT